MQELENDSHKHTPFADKYNPAEDWISTPTVNVNKHLRTVSIVCIFAYLFLNKFYVEWVNSVLLIFPLLFLALLSIDWAWQRHKARMGSGIDGAQNNAFTIKDYSNFIGLIGLVALQMIVFATTIFSAFAIIIFAITDGLYPIKSIAFFVGGVVSLIIISNKKKVIQKKCDGY